MRDDTAKVRLVLKFNIRIARKKTEKMKRNDRARFLPSFSLIFTAAYNESLTFEMMVIERIGCLTMIRTKMSYNLWKIPIEVLSLSTQWKKITTCVKLVSHFQWIRCLLSRASCESWALFLIEITVIIGRECRTRHNKQWKNLFEWRPHDSSARFSLLSSNSTRAELKNSPKKLDSNNNECNYS